MRTHGTPDLLEYRRLLAVERFNDGYSAQEVADFLGVDSSSVRRWIAAFRQNGASGLAKRRVSGRPPKLSVPQEKMVCRWLLDNPTEHGFSTELWTAPRVAQMIEDALNVRFHPDYLTVWLRQHGFTPQKPRRRARENSSQAIAQWLAKDWPRIKKRPVGETHTCCGWTKAGC